MGLLRFILAVPTGALAIVCALAAVVSQGGRWKPELDVASHFAPFWVAGGVVVLALTPFLFRGVGRALVAFLGAVAVFGAGQLIWAELSRPTSPPASAGAPNQVKIVQFNTLGRNRDVDGTADWIAAQDADVIVIEEAKHEIRDAIVKRTGYYVTCARCQVMIFSKAKPIADGGDLTHYGGPRAPTVWARFNAPGGPFTVVGVHYTWPTGGDVQQRQAFRLAETLDKLPKARTVLCGDFNSTPWSQARRHQDQRFGLERRTKALFSWPTKVGNTDLPFPFLPIDHVYAGSDWSTISVTRGPRLGSDHYPVVAVLALKR